MTLSQLIYKTINFHRQEFAGCWDSWVKKVQDKRNENSLKNFLNLPFIRFLLFAYCYLSLPVNLRNKSSGGKCLKDCAPPPVTLLAFIKKL